MCAELGTFLDVCRLQGLGLLAQNVCTCCLVLVLHLQQVIAPVCFDALHLPPTTHERVAILSADIVSTNKAHACKILVPAGETPL